MPEQRLQPAVDARQLRDRLGGSQAHRAVAEAVNEGGGDLGGSRRSHRRSGGRGPRRSAAPGPPTARRRVAAGARGRLPRPQEVAGAEQLGADVVGNDQLAREHAADNEQADVVDGGPGEPRDVPRSDGKTMVLTTSSRSACSRRTSLNSAQDPRRRPEDAPCPPSASSTRSLAQPFDRTPASSIPPQQRALAHLPHSECRNTSQDRP